MSEAKDLSGECFVIAPIGPDGSTVRRRSDNVLQVIIRPAVDKIGLRAVRADEIEEPGHITDQVIRHVIGARLVVADLTGLNANVFWELGVRHSFRLPVVLLAESSTELPFDVLGLRTIKFDSSDLISAQESATRLEAQGRAALAGDIGSPVSVATSIGNSSGDATTRMLSDLLSAANETFAAISRVESMGNLLMVRTARLHRRPPRPMLRVPEGIEPTGGIVIDPRLTSLKAAIAGSGAGFGPDTLVCAACGQVLIKDLWVDQFDGNIKCLCGAWNTTRSDEA